MCPKPDFSFTQHEPMLEQKEKIQLNKGVEDKLDGMIDGSIGLMHQTARADNATDCQISAQV